MEERSLCMREAPGSIPGFSNSYNRYFILDNELYAFWRGERLSNDILGSIVVSIPACHAGDRGSIPRRGGFF